MLNEFAYCPRLAYLEWVQGEFVHNLDTLEGRFGHRRVDEPTRADVPVPSPSPRPLPGERENEGCAKVADAPSIGESTVGHRQRDPPAAPPPLRRGEKWRRRCCRQREDGEAAG